MNTKTVILPAILALSAGATDPPIACNMKALTSEQRKQLGQLGEKVISAITASREMSDGYAFRVDPAKASLMDVAQWLDVWRRCCTFYEFQIDFHAADCNLWLLNDSSGGSAKVPYPIVLGDDATAKKYGIENMPGTFLIDRQGRIDATYVGVVDKNDVDANIRAMLADPGLIH